MSVRWSGIFAVLVLAALTGCGKDKGVGPKPTEIYGTWNATKVEYISQAAPSARFSLCDSVGGGATLVIQSDHNITFVTRCPPMPPDTTTGTWQLDGDVFKMYPSTMTWHWEWDIELSASTLTLSGAGMWWDFRDGNGPRDATQNMVLVR